MIVPILRPYQQEQKAGVYGAWQEGLRHVLAVLPTGGGKSVEIGDIVNDFNRDRIGAVIAHRQELVGQMSLHIGRFGVKHRIIAPKNVVSEIIREHRSEFGRSFVDPTARASVAGVDTLVSRADELKPWAQQCGYWVIDEAHHVLRTNKWGTAVAMFPNALGLGVTATPQRADGNGLGAHAQGVFERMIVGPSMRELIRMGNLTDYEIVIPASDFNVDKLTIGASGDYSSKQMREASRESHIVGDVVEQYIKYAYGKRGVVFATDVETSNEIAAKFALYGIPAQSVSSKTPDDVRAEYIRRFRAGVIWVLVNVDLFGEGFDLPAIEVVSMARPTASLAVFLQQFGRALRPMLGKLRGLIIDHVSNVKRHGLPDRDRIWTLDNRERRSKKRFDPDDIPIKTCTKCSRAYEAINRACPYCGYEPLPGVSGGRTVKMVEGDLMLLDSATLEQMRKATQLASPGAMPVPYGASDIVAKGIANRQGDKIMAQQALAEAIAVWAGGQRAIGKPDHETYRRFFHATSGIDVASALSADKTRVEYDTLREAIEQW